MLPRVLVAEDDESTAGAILRCLTEGGNDVRLVTDGRVALHEATTEDYDALVLDLRLPGLDGRQVCAKLRHHSSLPVLMLTALGSEEDVVAGFEAGADDYLTKPFSPRELVLRVRALLRRAHVEDSEPGRIRDGDLLIDTRSRRVTVDEQPIALTDREYRLLVFLASHPDTVLAHEDLLAAVWGWSHGGSATVTVHMHRLRQKIEPDPAHPSRLLTVWGVGYRYMRAVATDQP